MNTLDYGIGLHTHRVFANIAPAFGIEPPEWTLAAVCASTDPDLFHVDKGGDTRPAKRICADCPVRVECLTDAIMAKDEFGVRGGLAPEERRRLVTAGWQPGDAVPDPSVRRGPRGGVSEAGTCEECGGRYARVGEHVKRRHGYLRGVA